MPTHKYIPQEHVPANLAADKKLSHDGSGAFTSDTISADAPTLEGHPAAYFLAATATAVDSDKLDTKHATDFGQLVLDNTWSGANVFKDLKKVLKADAFAGATAGNKIAAAIVALPSTGGVVDARGLTGTQTIDVDIFAGTTKSILLLLGAGTYTVSIPLALPIENCWIKGLGPRTTVLKAGIADWVIKAISPTYGGQLFRVSDLTVDGNKDNFAASGGIYVKGYGQPSLIDNVIDMEFGSKGGLYWTGNAGTLEANVGGGLHNVWVLGDAGGVVGGDGAGDCITIDDCWLFNMKYIFCEYAPNGIVVKNTHYAAGVSACQVHLEDFHNEGITGTVIDLQANVYGFTAKNLGMVGGGGSNIGIKTASTATAYDFQNVYLGPGAGWLTEVQIAGVNWSPTNKFLVKFTDAIYQTEYGIVFWAGRTKPADLLAAVHICSDDTVLIKATDKDDVLQFQVTKAGALSINPSTATTATAGTNGDVPTQVVGYIIVNIGGTDRKIPFYAT